MRNSNLFPTIVMLMLLLSGCSATKQIAISTVEPSPVTFSNTIKKIGIINATVPTEGNAVQTRLDQIIASEERWLTEQGTDAAITGLFDELLKDKRFETIKLLDSVPQGMQDFGADPKAISWAMVESLCREYGVDAVFSLAFYEADTKVSIKKTSMMQPNLMRVKVKVPAQEITLETLIENGWRIYDPKNQQLIDEIVFNDQVVSTGKGVDPVQAYKAIGDRKKTMLEQSRANGSNYGLRMLPSESSIARDYFVKGSDNLVAAEKKMQTGDLDGAAELWELEVANPKPKISGRACYNMAVANEYRGNLEGALDWAMKSLEISEEKDTQAYIDALRQRIAQKGILEQQLAQNEFSE